MVCFRYAGSGLDDDMMGALNKEILVELQERGIAVPSGTTIRGKCALRVANVNHRSRREDFDILVCERYGLGMSWYSPVKLASVFRDRPALEKAHVQ